MNLQHHILIAMPSLDDPYFARSVVYLCEHNENGAMGLVINKPIEQLSVGKILQKLKISPTSVMKISRWKTGSGRRSRFRRERLCSALR